MATKQTLPKPVPEQDLALVKPFVWDSAIFPGRKIAVSVRDIQLICKSGKHGSPPDDISRQFLLYCAGYGLDPRIQQAYLIPYEEETEDGRSFVRWQQGVQYLAFMKLANDSGFVIGHEFRPDPAQWPSEYRDDFAAECIVYRRPPMKPIRYFAKLGTVAKKRGGKLSAAWRDDKVGWQHMFRVALLRRGFREAVFGSPAYGAEEFGEPEPGAQEAAEESVYVPAREEWPEAPLDEQPETHYAAGAPPKQEAEPSPPPAEAKSEAKERPAGAVGDCPECGRPVFEVKTKTGRRFLSCSGFKNGRACQWAEWDLKFFEKQQAAEEQPTEVFGYSEKQAHQIAALLPHTCPPEEEPDWKNMPRGEIQDWIDKAHQAHQEKMKEAFGTPG